MLIIVHLSLMIAALLCVAAGIGLAMFGRKKKFWLKWHRRFNTAGFCLLASGAAMAFTHVAISGDEHLEGPHQWIGLITFVLTAVTLYLGFSLLKTANKPDVRMAHRWTGRISMLAMGTALALGLRMIGVL
jgi:phosphatidylserine synthase